LSRRGGDAFHRVSIFLPEENSGTEWNPSLPSFTALRHPVFQLHWRSNPQAVTKQFDGKVALVTGGASGIGREAAFAFAKNGATVALADIAATAGMETAQSIERSGASSMFTQSDVTNVSQVQAMFRQIEQAYGRLDFAFNNAGIDGVRAPTAEYSEETWTKVLEVNLTGVFLCMKHEIPIMLRQGGGVIINMASVAGVTGFPAHAAYTASKHGVIGLTKTAALEYARAGIRVNALCPTYTRTPMVERMIQAQPDLEARLEARVPLGRLGTPEEIAGAVIYLCSDAASFITGHALLMDGGIMAA
jgi:NAD(P)-dependent dehydrogenase (short-subunit alcohol dehydrogenase family)